MTTLQRKTARRKAAKARKAAVATEVQTVVTTEVPVVVEPVVVEPVVVVQTAPTLEERRDAIISQLSSGAVTNDTLVELGEINSEIARRDTLGTSEDDARQMYHDILAHEFSIATLTASLNISVLRAKEFGVNIDPRPVEVTVVPEGVKSTTRRRNLRSHTYMVNMEEGKTVSITYTGPNADVPVTILKSDTESHVEMAKKFQAHFVEMHGKLYTTEKARSRDQWQIGDHVYESLKSLEPK